MKRPTKRLFGYTWIGILNVLFVQLFFIRIVCMWDTELPCAPAKFGILFFVFPFTGWSSEYISIGTIRQFYFN